MLRRMGIVMVFLSFGCLQLNAYHYPDPDTGNQTEIEMCDNPHVNC